MEYFQSKHINHVIYINGSGKQHDDGSSPKQPTPIGFNKGGNENITPFKPKKKKKTENNLESTSITKYQKTFVASFSDNKYIKSSNVPSSHKINGIFDI